MDNNTLNGNNTFEADDLLGLTKRVKYISSIAYGFVYILFVINFALAVFKGLTLPYVIGGFSILLLYMLFSLFINLGEIVKSFVGGLSLALFTIILLLLLDDNSQKTLVLIIMISLISYIGNFWAVVMAVLLFILFINFEKYCLLHFKELTPYFSTPDFTWKQAVLIYVVIFMHMLSMFSLLGLRSRILKTASKGADSLSKMRKEFETNLEFARKIANGDYSYQLKANEKNELGDVLNEMKNSIRKAAEDEQKRNWVVQGSAETSDILRKNLDNIDEMPNEIIKFLVKYLNANQGAIFYVFEDDLNEKYYQLKGAYAYERRKFIDKRIDVENGVLGQIYKEKRLIYLKDVPDNYVHITSGLGYATPSEVIVSPLKVDEEIVGAIEIATFEEFQEHEIELIKKVSEIIGSTVLSSTRNEETNKLLEESKQMAEEMRAQEEEMRQNMEELEATQEDLKRKNEEREKYEVEMRKYQAFLESVLEKLPYPVYVKDISQKYVMVNKAFCDIVYLDKSELLFNESASLFETGSPFHPEHDEFVFRTQKTHIDSVEFDNNLFQITRSLIKDEDNNKYVLGTMLDLNPKS